MVDIAIHLAILDQNCEYPCIYPMSSTAYACLGSMCRYANAGAKAASESP